MTVEKLYTSFRKLIICGLGLVVSRLQSFDTPDTVGSVLSLVMLVGGWLLLTSLLTVPVRE